MRPGLCPQKTVPTIDIVRIAKELVQMHGPDAALISKRWVECARQSGDASTSNVVSAD